MLSCDLPPLPCRGFTGDCALLQTQFAGVNGDDGAVMLDPDWVCTAFPDDNSSTDGYVVALISVAVCFPITGILALLFDLSNEIEMPDGWMEQPDSKWQRILLGGRDPVRGWHWHYDEGSDRPEHDVLPRRQPVNWMYLWLLNNGDTPLVLLIIGWAQKLCETVQSALGFARAEQGGDTKEESTDAEAPEAAAAEERENEAREAQARQRKSRILAGLGMFGVYVTWVIMVWFIFGAFLKFVPK